MGYRNAFAAWMQEESLSRLREVKMIRRSASMAANTAIISLGSTKL